MGVLNVTPDSFSDGGFFIDPGRAVEQALNMIENGADIIDVGGESTRPGAAPVTEEEELSRVIPVIRAITSITEVPVSVDTRRSAVAWQAIDAGALIVNDVSGFTFDPDMIGILAARKPIAVAMHMRGTPDTMQQQTQYSSLVGQIISETMPAIQRAIEAGLPKSQIWFDPGIGFAKTAEQNAEIIKQIQLFDTIGFPVLIGPSRKAFIGALTGKKDPLKRVYGTAAAVAASVLFGARILRVHDVAEMNDVVKVAWAIARSGTSGREDAF
jgi:dihydropteroate synthase